jgi:hypothetical protein
MCVPGSAPTDPRDEPAPDLADHASPPDVAFAEKWSAAAVTTCSSVWAQIVEGDALVVASETGGFLNTNNWRNRVWNPACKRAGVKATPYDGRHTYASLLIAEGRHPLLVSAALGHASGELVWRRYAHLFDEARHHSEPFSMVGAMETARAKLERSGLRASCAQGTVRVLRATPQAGRK